jgi:hypothetical protein
MESRSTNYMINRQDGNKVNEIELMGNKYEKVESFKYLGAVIQKLRSKVKLLLVINAIMH